MKRRNFLATIAAILAAPATALSSPKEVAKPTEAIAVTFEFTFAVCRREIPGGFIAAAFDATNRCNSHPTTIHTGGIDLSFAPGELMFCGIHGGKSREGGWLLQYHLASSTADAAGRARRCDLRQILLPSDA